MSPSSLSVSVCSSRVPPSQAHPAVLNRLPEGLTHSFRSPNLHRAPHQRPYYDSGKKSLSDNEGCILAVNPIFTTTTEQFDHLSESRFVFIVLYAS
ncbi:hypothetical protein RvY_15220, partial [Ramazzottius varieornatus]